MFPNEHRPTSRVLDILEVLASAKQGRTLTEIAAAIGAPKSSILPVVRTLCQRRFIALNRQSFRYTVSINAFVVGTSYLEHMDVLSLVKSEMRRIVDASSETCQMGTLVGGDVLYLIKIDSPEPIRLVSFVGKRLPAYCTALGKALLSNHSLDDLRLIYPDGLRAMTPRTITDVTALHSALRRIRETNIAADVEEITSDLQCLAVPLRKDGQVMAAISVSTPNFRAAPEKMDLIRRLLLNAQAKLERTFHELSIDQGALSFPL